MRRHVFFDQRVIGVDMAFGIEVDQHFRLGKSAAQRLFDALDDLVRGGYTQRPIHLHVELREMVRARAAGAEIVDALQARLACSEKTVEQRLTRLFQRTGCRSRVELAAAWLDGSLARLAPAAEDTPRRGAGAGAHPADGAGAAPDGW